MLFHRTLVYFLTTVGGTSTTVAGIKWTASSNNNGGNNRVLLNTDDNRNGLSIFSDTNKLRNRVTTVDDAQQRKLSDLHMADIMQNRSIHFHIRCFTQEGTQNIVNEGCRPADMVEIVVDSETPPVSLDDEK